MTDVVVVTERERSRADALAELTQRIAELGWLAEATGRILINVGQSSRSALVTETARALAGAMQERAPDARVTVLDGRTAWPGSGGERDALPESLQVTGLGGSSVRLPREWFEPCYLATVAGVCPDDRWRLCGILGAQAELLAPFNPGVPERLLLREAHRLGRSDLAVMCATDETGSACWTAGENDVDVEVVMACAAGLAPEDLPSLRVLAEHELIEHDVGSGPVPRLPVVPRSQWRAAWFAARDRGVMAERHAREDAVRVLDTLSRVPHAIRRRLASRFGRRARS